MFDSGGKGKMGRTDKTWLPVVDSWEALILGRGCIYMQVKKHSAGSTPTTVLSQELCYL